MKEGIVSLCVHVGWGGLAASVCVCRSVAATGGIISLGWWTLGRPSHTPALFAPWLPKGVCLAGFLSHSCTQPANMSSEQNRTCWVTHTLVHKSLAHICTKKKKPFLFFQSRYYHVAQVHPIIFFLKFDSKKWLVLLINRINIICTHMRRRPDALKKRKKRSCFIVHGAGNVHTYPPIVMHSTDLFVLITTINFARGALQSINI